MKLSEQVAILAAAAAITSSDAHTAFQGCATCSAGRPSQEVNMRRLASPTMGSLLQLPRPRRSSADIFREMDEMFDRAFDSSFMTMKPAPFFSRRAEFPVLQNQALRRPYIYNIAEDEKKFQLSFEVPGVKPSNLSVHLEQDGRILRISGVREVKHGDMSYESNFDKAFALDKSVDVEKITANLSEGIMTIDAPKKAKIESKSIDIPIQVNYPDTQIEFPLEKAALDNDADPSPTAEDTDVDIEAKANEEEDTIDFDKDDEEA
jgi:HSP20 family protein